MRTNHLLSLIVSGGTVAALAIWVLRQTPGPIGLAAFAGAGLWFSLCLIRFLGQGVGRSTPDFTQGRGFGRISTDSGRSSALQSGQSAVASETEDDGDDLISLVLLLAEPRDPNASSISRCVSTALEVELDPDDPHATEFVIRMPTPSDRKHSAAEIDRFMVKLDLGVFAVLSSAQPYMTKGHTAAKRDIRDKRLRSAIEDHRAWLSIDLMGTPGDAEEKASAYRNIALMLAAMAGPDCLAICCPERQQCNEFDPGLIEVLRSDHPLSLFDDPTFAPVIEVSNDDPRLKAAVDEARLRWSEFVEARQLADDDDSRFLAKAEFSEGDNSEFMWVQVSTADDSLIEGLLVNEPHELENVHCGQAVSVPVDQLNDWIFPGDDGHMVGGFTLEIIADSDE